MNSLPQKSEHKAAEARILWQVRVWAEHMPDAEGVGAEGTWSIKSEYIWSQHEDSNV